MELDVDEFIHRLLLHVPIKGQRLVRCYGLFSSSKKKELNQARRMFGQLPVVKVEREKVEVLCRHCGHEMIRMEKIEPAKRTAAFRREYYKKPQKNIFKKVI